MASKIKSKLLAAIGASILYITFCTCASSQNMQVHFIDVGQGAATLVEFPCAAILVDTGGETNPGFDSNPELVAYLDGFFHRRADLNGALHSLILTHPHIDHTRGVQDVLARYKILNAVTNGQEQGSGQAGQIALHRKVSATEGTNSPIGFVAAQVKDIPKNQGLTNNVISPVKCPNVDPKVALLWGSVDDNLGWKRADFNNLNNHSAIIRVDFGKASVLIQGDLEDAAIPDFRAHYANSNLLAVDVYEVGHHGSVNGTTDELLQAMAPKIAVMAMGSETRHATFSAWGFGHPRKTTVDRLERFVSSSRNQVTVDVATGQHAFEPKVINKAIYGTGWDGSVVLESDTGGTWRSLNPTMAAVDRLDINAASADQLAGLPMIGDVRAKAIVDHRGAHGPFTSLDQLLDVKGLGPATLTGIRSRIIIGNVSLR
jgi:competence protein ComEC